MPSAIPGDLRLTQAMLHYQDLALSNNTRTTYAAGVRAFQLFLIMNNIQRIHHSSLCHPSELIFMYFVTHCAHSLRLSYTTIKTYLSGIRNAYIQLGLGDPLLDSNGTQLSRLQLIMRGIHKQQKTYQRPRLPITVDILNNICILLQAGVFGKYTDKLLHTTCVLAFFGFLRCGEFTCNSQFCKDSNVTLSDVQFKNDNNNKACLFHIKSSKTDPFRKGHTITLFQTDNILCPVQALETYHKIRQAMGAKQHDPLFVTQEGHPLSRESFISLLRTVLERLGYNPTLYAGHSFRIGAATTAAAAGIPDHLIKTLGRWSSDCYTVYIRTPQSIIASAHKRLAHRC